jgi:Cdc6-like AAA superfamily ATPase
LIGLLWTALLIEGLREAFNADGGLILDGLTFWGWVYALIGLAAAGLAALTPKRGGPLVWSAVAFLLFTFASTDADLDALKRLAGALGALLLAAAIASPVRRLFAQPAHPNATARFLLLTLVAGYAALTLSPQGTLYLVAASLLLYQLVPAVTARTAAAARALRELFLQAERTATPIVRSSEPSGERGRRLVIGGIIDYINGTYGPAKWENPQVSEVIDAPAFTSYVLLKPDAVDVKTFLRESSNLAIKLGIDEERLNLATTGARGGIVIQIAKDDDEVETLWYDDLIDAYAAAIADKPYEVLLGTDTFGDPVSIDMGSKTQPHLLLTGASGSGKTSTLHSILCQLITKCSPAEFQFGFVDPKIISAAKYERLPHLWRPVTDDAGAPPLLKEFDDEMMRRLDLFKADPARPESLVDWNTLHPTDPLPLLVLVIDEATELGGKEAPAQIRAAYERHVGRIARMGRGAGVYVFLAAQRPSVQNLGENIVGQIPQRVVHKLEKASESGMALQADGDESALRLRKGGDGFVVTGGRRIRFSAAYLPPMETPGRPGVSVPALVEKAIKSWGGPNRFGPTANSPTPGTPATAAAASTPEALRTAHTAKCTDREWLILCGLRERVAPFEGAREFDPVETSPVELAALADAAAVDFGYKGPAFDADEVARSLPRFFPGEQFAPDAPFTITFAMIMPGPDGDGVIGRFAASEDGSDEPEGPSTPSSGGSGGGAPTTPAAGPRRPSLADIAGRPGA